MTGISKAAGTLKRAARAKRKPARRMFILVGLGFSKIKKAKREKPIMKFSAFAIFPSNMGMVVRRAKMMVEMITSKPFGLVNSF